MNSVEIIELFYKKEEKTKNQTQIIVRMFINQLIETECLNQRIIYIYTNTQKYPQWLFSALQCQDFFICVK